MIIHEKFLKHSIQVTSFGGSGTTMLYHFFSQFHMDIPGEPDGGPWKHLRTPPGLGENEEFMVKKDFKAVYLMSNPMNAVISLFHRRYHHYHVGRMGIKDKSLDKNLTLEEYLTQGEDIYLMEEQFNNWTKCPKEGRPYPIMLLKYEKLWEHVPELFKFLNVPLDLIDSFPQQKERTSDWEQQPSHIRQKLYNIYGKLHETIERFPEITVI